LPALDLVDNLGFEGEGIEDLVAAFATGEHQGECSRQVVRLIIEEGVPFGLVRWPEHHFKVVLLYGLECFQLYESEC
jgi:hypothetical protein